MDSDESDWALVSERTGSREGRCPRGHFGRPRTLYENGEEVPWQVETIDGAMHLWVKTTLEEGQVHSYELKKSPAHAKGQAVQVSSDDSHWFIDNGQVALKLPKQTSREKYHRQFLKSACRGQSSGWGMGIGMCRGS